MRYYELVVVYKPTLTEQEQKEKLEALKKFLQDNGAEIVKFTEWGRRELAYPIQKFNTAYYYIINYKTDNYELPPKLEYNLRIDEDVIRFLNFKIHPKKLEEKKEEQPQEAEQVSA
jgi:small subunit ribosomal protein S6